MKIVTKKVFAFHSPGSKMADYATRENRRAEGPSVTEYNLTEVRQSHPALGDSKYQF